MFFRRLALLLLPLMLSGSTLPPPPDDVPLPLRRWQAGAVVTTADVQAWGLERCFAAVELDDAVFARMQGHSYVKGCPVARADLRYLRVLHYDADGRIRMGEMVCHRTIAQDLLAIFRELYAHRYPIGRMVLIDDYGADDERSMRANNSSCFCYRAVSGTSKLSKHAQGLAIDLNPLYNPCVRRGKDGKRHVQPATAAPYADRSKPSPYKIVPGDLCYRLFRQHGFRWGGDWRTLKDYQHFEK